jgi:hypothetical protein
MNLVHIIKHYFPKTHSNIILPYTHTCSELSFFQVFQPKFLCISHLSHPCYMPLPSNTPWLEERKCIQKYLFTICYNFKSRVSISNLSSVAINAWVLSCITTSPSYFFLFLRLQGNSFQYLFDFERHFVTNFHDLTLHWSNNFCLLIVARNVDRIFTGSEYVNSVTFNS